MHKKTRWCALLLLAQVLLVSSVATADQKWFSVGEVCGKLEVDGKNAGAVTYSVLLAAAKDRQCCEGTKKMVEGKTDTNGRFDVADLQPGQYFFVAKIENRDYVFPIWMDRLNKHYCSNSIDQIFAIDSATGQTEVTVEATSTKNN